MLKKITLFIYIISILIGSSFKLAAANVDEEYHYQLTYGVNERFLIYTLSLNREQYIRNFMSVYNSASDANIALIRRESNTLALINAEQGSAPFVDELENYILAFLISYTQRANSQFVISIDIYKILANNFVYGSFEYVNTYSWSSQYINGQDLIFNIDYDSIIDTNNIPLNQEITFNYLKLQFANNGVLLPDQSALGQLTQGFYNNGYNAGFNAANNQGAFLRSVFITIDSFLDISVLPGITIGLFVAVPLVFGMVELILKFWRKD